MLKGYLFAFSSLVCMALAPLFNKIALEEVSSLDLVFYNALVASLIGLAIKGKNIFNIKGQLSSYLMIGCLNGFALFCLFSALDILHPGFVSFINRFYIFFSFLWAYLFLNEKLNSKQYGLIILASIGMALFLYRPTGAWSLKGAFYALGSAFFFSLQNFLAKKKIKKMDSVSLVTILNIITVLVFLPFIKMIPGSSSFFYIGGASLLGSFLGLYLFYQSLKYLNLTQANYTRIPGPLIAFLIALPFYPVQLSHLNFLGAGFMLLSFFLNAFNCKEKEKPRFELYLDNKDQLPTSFDSVLVLLKHRNKWVFVKNKKRAWEFPGGHREHNESIEETAKREAKEEAGAHIKNIQTAGFYRLANGHTTIITKAEVDFLTPLKEYFETSKVILSRKLPKELSFQDGLYQELWRAIN